MENMKKILLLFSVAMLLLSCKQKAPDKICDTDVICDSYNEFCEKKDSSSLVYFIDTLKRFDTKTFNNDMALKESVQNQIALCLSLAEGLQPLILEKENHKEEILLAVHEMDKVFMSFLKNKNASLKETHQKLYVFFIYFTLTILIGGAILVVLNIKEVLEKDKMLYSSQVFLKHSILIQEAERKRISRELHDSVAQNLRYVSLLAENISDKDTAAKIIETQNQNIENIRNLCYNLTPPSITKDNLLSLVNVFAKKIFGESFQFRLIAENDVDFSCLNADELLNIYRIVQEALQNIKNHAGAKEVTVFFKRNPLAAEPVEPARQKAALSKAISARAMTAKNPRSHLKIIISDDGCGMDEELVKEINSAIFEKSKESHFGVRNICERVKLHSLYSELKIIVYSMFFSAGMVQTAIQNGAAGYISKNAPSDELIECMENAFSGKTFVQKELRENLVKFNSFTDALTQREKQVMALILQNLSNMQIAEKLQIRQRAVENYISSIYEKTGINDKKEFISQFGK